MTPLAVPLGVGKVPGAAKSVRNDFPDDSATSESLCDTQDSFWEESEARGKQISDIRDFELSAVAWQRPGASIPPWGRCESAAWGRRGSKIIFLAPQEPREAAGSPGGVTG